MMRVIKRASMASLALIGLLGLVSGCGGGPGVDPSSYCTDACTAVASRCGGAVGAIGARPGGCPAACAEVVTGAEGVLGCVQASATCEQAQACFTAGPGNDGGGEDDMDNGKDLVGPSPDRAVDPDAAGCGGEVVGNEMVVPNIFLVLDQSGSMSERDFGPNSEERMAVLKRAMATVLDDQSLAGRVRWGMTAFPQDPGDPFLFEDCLFFTCDPFGPVQQFEMCAEQCALMYGGCTVFDGMNPTVGLGDNTAAAVKDAVNRMVAQGSTPSNDALRAAKNYLTQPGIITAEHPTYVLLGTDGEPTCTDGQTGNDTVAAASELAAAGIKTFVVGIAFSSASSGHSILNAVAQAGGTARGAGGTDYYPANSEQELVDSIRGITTALAGCNFALQRPAPNPLLINVYVDGQPLPRDDNNGFSYRVDMSGAASISINGSYCEELKNNSGASVQVRFGCAPQG